MNLLLLSDDASEKVSSGTVLPAAAELETTVNSVEEEIIASRSQVTVGDSSLATDDDGDSIAEVEDGLAEIRLRRIDKMPPADTPDSLLSTSDTLSSYSGCSVGGVGEPFVAVFEGVRELSHDDVWNGEGDTNNDDDDSAVHVCSVDDGSLCGSVASSHDQTDECMTNVSTTLSNAADGTCIQNVKDNSLSWY